MPSSLFSVSYILIITEFAAGNVANSFIILVNCYHWVKRQKISLADQIMTALALSRISLLWIMCTYGHTVVFDPNPYNLEMDVAFLILSTVSSHFSLWFATSLSIFYLLKIANFPGFLFLYLKWRIKEVLLTLMLGSLAILISQIAVEGTCIKRLIHEDQSNATWKGKLTATLCLSNVLFVTVANVIPFTMSLMCLLLLIFSLVKHLKKMKPSDKGTRDPHTQVHRRALLTVTSFLLMFACYFLLTIISVWSSHGVKRKLVLQFCVVTGLLYPSGHSFILIWGNKKLKETFLSFLWQLRC